MSKFEERVQTILSNWSGEDDAEHRSPREVAREIDDEMDRYLKSLAKQTADIRAGQREHERRVA
jgi:hypothetical protein